MIYIIHFVKMHTMKAVLFFLVDCHSNKCCGLMSFWFGIDLIVFYLFIYLKACINFHWFGNNKNTNNKSPQVVTFQPQHIHLSTYVLISNCFGKFLYSTMDSEWSIYTWIFHIYTYCFGMESHIIMIIVLGYISCTHCLYITNYVSTFYVEFYKQIIFFYFSETINVEFVSW